MRQKEEEKEEKEICWCCEETHLAPPNYTSIKMSIIPPSKQAFELLFDGSQADDEEYEGKTWKGRKNPFMNWTLVVWHNAFFSSHSSLSLFDDIF